MLKVLCKVVKEVKIAVDYTPHIIESQDIPENLEERQIEIPMLVQPVRTQVSGEVLDLGTP